VVSVTLTPPLPQQQCRIDGKGEGLNPSVSVEVLGQGGARSYAIKIGTPLFEINVTVPFADAAKLKRVRNTPWLSGALQIGESAGAPAWWCVNPEHSERQSLSILVGHDDQTWDIALQFPLETIDMVVQEVGACSHEASDSGGHERS
jgi:hypothetical protein